MHEEEKNQLKVISRERGGKAMLLPQVWLAGMIIFFEECGGGGEKRLDLLPNKVW